MVLVGVFFITGIFCWELSFSALRALLASVKNDLFAQVARLVNEEVRSELTSVIDTEMFLCRHCQLCAQWMREHTIAKSGLLHPLLYAPAAT
jgi:hypothetical protein